MRLYAVMYISTYVAGFFGIPSTPADVYAGPYNGGRGCLHGDIFALGFAGKMNSS